MEVHFDLHQVQCGLFGHVSVGLTSNTRKWPFMALFPQQICCCSNNRNSESPFFVLKVSVILPLFFTLRRRYSLAFITHV